MDFNNRSYYPIEDWNITYTGRYDFNYTVPMDSVIQKMYFYIPIIMVSLCIVSVAINVMILLSIFWIRRPISPTLHISLSLAASDLWNGLLLGITVLLNSFLPVVYKINSNTCLLLFLEGLRMGGMFTMICHLLALAGNHYLGIRKPLHYPSLMTYRNIAGLLIVLWFAPPTGFIVFFHVLPEDDGFNVEGCAFKFLTKTKFRSAVSLIFAICLAIMATIYMHIYMLVRRHQANRNRFRRVGSTYSRNSQLAEHHHNQTRNEKALCTTLLIVGTVLMGWLPATVTFYFVCDDCIVGISWGTPVLRTIVYSSNNVMLILKTCVNSYIYAARMKEIKEAMRKMRNTIVMRCWKRRNQDLMTNQNSEVSRHFISRTSTRRSKRTVLCRLNSIPRGEVANREVGDFSTPL